MPNGHLSANELAFQLGGKKEDNYWKAHCPAHDDARASLSISEKDGKVLIHCHANCPQEDVIAALRRRGLWYASSKANGQGQDRRIAATYDYVDEKGSLLSQAVRFEPKGFLQRRPDGRGGWIWNTDGTPKVPYRLPALLEAIGRQQVVFVVEGEKDVNNLLNLNIIATSNACGAGKWTAQHAAYLKDADVVLIPDNDDAGRQHAADVASSLSDLAKRVRLLALPDLPRKGDVSDWLEAGGTAERLWQLAEQAPEWRPRGGDTHSRTEEWPDPVPLPHSLLPVAPFDYGLLPVKVRPWAEDMCERMQCPPDYVAVSVMAALGSLIGRRVMVRPQRADSWSEAPNQWALCIGRPGVMKSPAIEEALWPLKTLARAARERFKLAEAEYDVAAAAAKARAKNAEKEAGKLLAENKLADVSLLFEAEDIDEPILRRYLATNASIEALGELLQQNPNGVLVHRDEMLSLLDRLGEEGRADERGFYLTGWSGTSAYTFDRIGRGLDLHVDAVCLSMLGGTQPGRISQYLVHVCRGGPGDDGLIQRFGLMVWPDVPGRWTNVDRSPNRESREVALRAFQALDTSTGASSAPNAISAPTGSRRASPTCASQWRRTSGSLPGAQSMRSG